MPSSRRAVLLATATLAVGAGCVGPELDQDDSGDTTEDSSDQDSFEREDLEELTATVREAIELIDEAAVTFADWQEDPAAVDVATFDTLQTDATDLWSRYGNDVLPHTEDLREGDWTMWAGDADDLADLVADHDSLVGDVEEGAIGIQAAGGDPSAISSTRQDAVDRVVADGPELVDTTEAALSS